MFLGLGVGAQIQSIHIRSPHTAYTHICTAYIHLPLPFSTTIRVIAIMSSILNTATMLCLNKTNYLTWNVRMRTLLIRNDLWSIVSGMEAVPDPKTAASTEVEAYTLRQLKAAAKITLYVNDTQIIHVQGDDPKVLTHGETPRAVNHIMGRRH